VSVAPGNCNGFTFLVLAHLGSARQNPESRKTVVVVVVCSLYSQYSHVKDSLNFGKKMFTRAHVRCTQVSNVKSQAILTLRADKRLVICMCSITFMHR